MKSNSKFFKYSKTLPVDEFFQTVLYDKKFGYYFSKQPFGSDGDFITSPKITSLFSEIIAVWIISTWEIFGKPKNFNIVELGPGDGVMAKSLLNVFKKFPEFYNAQNLFLFEKSKLLKKIQKNNIKHSKIYWINNFNKIKKGPIIFFGNEFFDAIPIKQFKISNNSIFEKCYRLEKNNKIKEIFQKASISDIKIIKSYKALKNLKFIEFPKLGFKELEKIVNKISELNGCIMLIDYGYLKPHNLSTLQSVMKHKKNMILENLGNADITSHVNFSLLKEFLLKKNLKVKKIISQRDFLKNMGILDRANLLSKKMKFSDQADLYHRLKRLLSSKGMGNLFKVILAYKHFKSNYYGFN